MSVQETVHNGVCGDATDANLKVCDLELYYTYTHYGLYGTGYKGRYQNFVPSNGTLDINILSQVGH